MKNAKTKSNGNGEMEQRIRSAQRATKVPAESMKCHNPTEQRDGR